MILYLAGDSEWQKLAKGIDYKTNRLDSYFYLKLKDDPHIDKYDNFLLDSGAFTYMRNKKLKTDWNQYVEEYAEYIKHRNIKNYIEMDIDSIIGVKDTLKLRSRLESLTGLQSIPCWHFIRGKQAWIDIVKEYSYASISLSGLTDTSKQFIKSGYKYLPWFLEQAKKHDCKVHGLGFTQSAKLPHFRFHSVDSSTWLNGGKYGFINMFDPISGRMRIIQRKGRLKANEGREHNFKQWILFQRYAEKYL